MSAFNTEELLRPVFSFSFSANNQHGNFPSGYFMEPTVFTDVEDHMFIAKEESFGPVMVVSKFQDG